MRSRVTAKGSGHGGLPVRPQQGASSQSVPFGCPYSAEEGPCAVPQPVAGALQPVYTHRARHVARSGLSPCSGPEEWTGRSGCRGEGRWPGGTSSRGLGHKRTRARNPVSPPRPQRPWPLRSLAVHTGAASTAPPTGTSAGPAGPGPVLFTTPRSLHGLLPLPRTRFPPPPACLWLSATFTSLSFHCPSATPGLGARALHPAGPVPRFLLVPLLGGCLSSWATSTPDPNVAWAGFHEGTGESGPRRTRLFLCQAMGLLEGRDSVGSGVTWGSPSPPMTMLP